MLSCCCHLSLCMFCASFSNNFIWLKAPSLPIPQGVCVLSFHAVLRVRLGHGWCLRPVSIGWLREWAELSGRCGWCQWWGRKRIWRVQTWRWDGGFTYKARDFRIQSTGSGGVFAFFQVHKMWIYWRTVGSWWKSSWSRWRWSFGNSCGKGLESLGRIPAWSVWIQGTRKPWDCEAEKGCRWCRCKSSTSSCKKQGTASDEGWQSSISAKQKHLSLFGQFQVQFSHAIVSCSSSRQAPLGGRFLQWNPAVHRKDGTRVVAPGEVQG